MKKELDEETTMLLARAAFAIHEGFVGGEWAACVPENIPYAAAREQDEAVNTLRDIRLALGWPTGDSP